MSKWVEITPTMYRGLKHEIKYHAVAGGRMVGGGVYTEYSPYSALTPRYPDLRCEMQGIVNRTEYRYFVLAEHDPRD